jgi:hypothetical protein
MSRLAIITAFVLFILNSHVANAQSPEEKKAWEMNAAPGEVQKMIAKWDGKWKGDVSMWMQPGAAPMKSTSMTMNKMIMGGRYQESHHTGSMMGKPFEGLGTLGYDNARKILVSTWIDNMGTGIMYMEGTWDNASKSATFKGKSTDPTSGKEMDVKEIFTVMNDNSQKLEMFMVMGGQEMKVMEIVYTRVK